MSPQARLRSADEYLDEVGKERITDLVIEFSTKYDVKSVCNLRPLRFELYEFLRERVGKCFPNLGEFDRWFTEMFATYISSQ